MLENSDIALNTATSTSNEKPRQAIGAALGSAFVPGLGQLALGEKVRAWVFFALVIIWFVLFLPPVRIPRFYVGVLFGLVFAVALTITASCQALRSRANGRRPGSYWWLVLLLPLACFAAGFFWIASVRISGFRDFRIVSSSMKDTIVPGDIVMTDTQAYWHMQPAHESIIVFNRPNERGVLVIKRVIASGGDAIRSVNGQIYLNGKILEEPYMSHTGGATDDMMNFGPIKIPAHKLFVMGDDRDISLDSRDAGFGLVDDSDVIGKAVYIFKAAHDRSGKHL